MVFLLFFYDFLDLYTLGYFTGFTIFSMFCPVWETIDQLSMWSGVNEGVTDLAGVLGALGLS